MIWLHEANPLNEMTIINPKLCKQLSIQVEVEQRDEGQIPHVHIYLDGERNKRNCSFVDLTKCEYAKHHKNCRRMSRQQKEQFIEVMTRLCPNVYMTGNDGTVKQANGYQAACITWANTFEDGSLDKFNLDDNGFIIPIDYSSL